MVYSLVMVVLIAHIQMMDESARLLQFQQQLEKEADGKISFFGLSVNDTIRALLINGMAKRADKVKADFKVPDKRYVTTSDFLRFTVLKRTSPSDSGTASSTP